MGRSCPVVALALAVAVMAAPAYGAITTIALPNNISMLGWSDGGTYAPLFDGAVHDLAGVPFQVGTADANAVHLTTVTVATNIHGAATAYSLVNSAWGVDGYTVGTLTFHGSAGASYVYSYVEGFNVRDHYLGGWVNGTTSGDVTQAVWGSPFGGAHLDMQTISLPAAFANQTLTSIDIAMLDEGFNGQGVIAGLTVSTVPVPEPATTVMLAAGLAVLAARARSRKAASRGGSAQGEAAPGGAAAGERTAVCT